MKGHQGDNQSAQTLEGGHLSSQNPSGVTPGDTLRRERPSQLSAVEAIPAEATDLTEQRGAIHTEPCLNS